VIERQRRTDEEILALKSQWTSDPCWDIEDTEGFAAHREELLAYRQAKEAEWAQERLARLEKRAAELGVPGNLALAEYVERLEGRLEVLTERIERLERQGEVQ
jgi:chromosome segregation ATPase